MGRAGALLTLSGFFEIRFRHAAGIRCRASRRVSGSGRKAARRVYNQIHAQVSEYLAERLPRPEAMKPEMYKRNITARAFDVARYLLCFGIPTGVGQVTSIRTLERQIRRLKTSEYQEVRELAGEIAEAVPRRPSCQWEQAASTEAVAPTLARHVDADEHLARSRENLRQWVVKIWLPGEQRARSSRSDEAHG